MDAAPRSRFRIHLSTLLGFVLMFSAMGYVCFFRNTQPPEIKTPDVFRRHTNVYGWPLTLVLQGSGTIYNSGRNQLEEYSYKNYRVEKSTYVNRVNVYFFGCLSVNLAVALIPSLLVAYFFERRARRNDPKPSEEPEEEFDKGPRDATSIPVADAPAEIPRGQ